MSVIEQVCLVKGHNIQALISKDLVDPMFKLVVHEYERRCTQCGKTLAEIERYKISSRGTARQKNGKPNAHITRSKAEAGASGESHQTPEPQPVPSPEPAVLEPDVQPTADQS